MLSRSWAYLRSLLGTAADRNVGSNGAVVPLLNGQWTMSGRVRIVQSYVGDAPVLAVGGVDAALLSVSAHSSAGSITILRNGNNADGALFAIGKSRSAAAHSVGGLLASGDEITRMFFCADDGVSIRRSSELRVVVEGTPISGVAVPSRMQLMPGNASGSQIEAMRLDSGGGVQVRSAMSNTSPGTGQLVARGLQVDSQTVSSTGAIAALASDTGLVRLTGAAPDVQGITAPTLGARMLWLYCASATTLRHASASAAAANRIATANGLDLVVTAGSTVRLIYDTTSAVWRV